MKIIITKHSIKQICVWYLLIYFLNKNLFDLPTSAFKLLYYTIIVITGLLGILKMLRDSRSTRGLVILFGLYSLYIVFNGLYLSNSYQFVQGIIQYLIYPLPIFSFYYCLDNTSDNYSLYSFYIKWGVVTSFLAFVEYTTKRPLLGGEYKVTTYYDGSRAFRASVFIGSPMTLAVLLAFVAVICFYLYNRKSQKKYLLYFLVNVLGIIFTGSRAPLVALIIGLAVMYATLFDNGKMSRNTFSRLLFFAGIGVSVIVIVFAFGNRIQFSNAAINQLITRMASTFNFTSEWGNMERLRRWTYYLSVFKENIFTGIGIAKTSAAVSTNQIIASAHGVTTESGVIGRLVESGIIGTGLYYIFFYRLLLLVKNNNADESTSLAYFWGVIAVFLVENIVLQLSFDIFVYCILSFIICSAMYRKLPIR